jgi:outer membrane protein TolC
MLSVQGLVLVSLVFAQPPESKTLPSPLTLEYALSLADESHPQLLLNEAEYMAAQARQKTVDSSDDLEARLEAQLLYVEPSRISFDQGNDDHRLGLILNKELYDFGLQAAKSKSAESLVAGYQYAYQDARAQRRLAILRRYFDVLLADLVFLRYNEEMAVEYILLDRLRARKELGKASDLEVLEQEQHYQNVRYLRADSLNKQRRTRALLAEALNRPGQLPNELAKPDLDVLKRELPEYEDLLGKAMANNYRLKMLYAKLEAAKQGVEVARATDSPKLNGVVEAYGYTREYGMADKFRAGVKIEVPLYNGEKNDSEIATARAELYKLQAQVQQAESEIRQAVLDTWLELDSLRIKRDHVNAIQQYREMDLDYRRTLYEMEVKADLGKGMAYISEAEFLVREAEYKMAAAWIKLDILTGQLNMPAQKQEDIIQDSSSQVIKEEQ